MCRLNHLVFICLVFLTHQVTSTEEIYKLSKEDYARMPPKLHLDRFGHCLNQPGGVYCTAHADVVADGPSELLDMMRGYSAYPLHFNYTQVRYGMCLTRNCREFYAGGAEPELTAAEGCLNRTLGRGYGLKARVKQINCYYEDQTKNKYKVDWVDYAVAAFFFAIFALNVAGSVYDCTRDQTKPGNWFLALFSWRRHWRALLLPPSLDPRAAALRSLNGVRFLTCLLIVMLHTPGRGVLAIENPEFFEKELDTAMYNPLYNGNLATQSFFLMSGFLLTYNMQIGTEKQPFTLSKYFKSIFLRFMRLAPMTYVALALTATVLRFADHGPFWQEHVGIDLDDCRAHWPYNVIFLNNLVDFSICRQESWSTAADFQLHVIGLTIILLAPSAARRRAALALLFAAGVLWPAYNVLTMDLDGVVMAKPEVILRYFKGYSTFNYLYKPTYASTPVFVIGMAFGYIVYDMQKRNVTRDYTKYRYAYWSLLPLLYLLVVSGGFAFYRPGPRAAPLARALFMPVVKPLFGLTVMLIIFGAANRVETLYRGVLEWRGWEPLGKLSFGVYSLHMNISHLIAGTDTTLRHNSRLQGIVDYLPVAALALLLSLVVHLSVEAPVASLAKTLCAPAPAQREDKKE